MKKNLLILITIASVIAGTVHADFRLVNTTDRTVYIDSFSPTYCQINPGQKLSVPPGQSAFYTDKPYQGSPGMCTYTLRAGTNPNDAKIIQDGSGLFMFGKITVYSQGDEIKLKIDNLNFN